MNTFSNQRGMSMWGMMVVAVMAGVLFLEALKLFPLYMEYFSMKGIIDQVKADPELKGVPKDKILRGISRRMDIGDFTNIDKNSYTVTKIEGRNAYTIELSYEASTPLFANLSMLVDFEYSAEVGE